ncbi:unnamed protein product, partial [marine sediment metagenome]
MKKIEIYILWDEDAGYRCDRFYLDLKSAKVGLEEQYTE